MKILLIDDIRTWDMVGVKEPTENHIIARTFDEGLKLLQDGDVEVLYLDHDLSDADDRKNGYAIMEWIEQNIDKTPQKFISVTANPVGRMKFLAAWDAIQNRIEEALKTKQDADTEYLLEVVVEGDGNKYWFLGDELRRTELNNGDTCYFLNGLKHRLDGPAFESTGGYKEWWINGQELTEEEFNSIVKDFGGSENGAT